MSMNKSLSIVQKLYESGYLTYPRTNSEYLATNEKDKIKTIIANISKMGYPVEFKDKKTIFDDTKIESHSALTPTYKIPKKENLTEEEYQVYQVVFQRFVAVFCSKKCKVEKTEITIKVGDYETFTLKGNIVLEPGWTKFDRYTSKDKILPNLSKGDKVNINFVPKEKETTPPKHYTTETLNNYLMNPFRKEKQEMEELAEGETFTLNGEEIDDTEDYKAMFTGLELGTDATRTPIITNAINSQYISLKNDIYNILPTGEYLINTLMQLGIQMDKYKTCDLGIALKQVFHNEISINDSIQIAENEIMKVFDKNKEDEKEIAAKMSELDHQIQEKLEQEKIKPSADVKVIENQIEEKINQVSKINNYQEIKEDCELYRELARRYLALDLTDPLLCFEVKKEAWALAQRWSDIASMATKIARLHDASKTDFRDWAYQRYRQLQYMHEDARMMWNKAEEELKFITRFEKYGVVSN